VAWKSLHAIGSRVGSGSGVAEIAALLLLGRTYKAPAASAANTTIDIENEKRLIQPSTFTLPGIRLLTCDPLVEQSAGLFFSHPLLYSANTKQRPGGRAIAAATFM
jgi:hypothetical protein